MLPTPRARRHRRRPRPWPDRLRHLAFATLYGPAAPVYDAFTRWLFLGEWARWQDTVLPLLPDTGLVVELGAGNARLAHGAARPYRPWVAVEPSAAMLRVARRHPRSGRNALVVRATAGSLPIGDAAAAAVVATFPGPYISAPATAAEVRRVLVPGGALVVVVDGALAPDSVRRRLRRFALRLFYGRETERPARQSTMAGIVGEVRRVRTRHGEAAVFVGRRDGRP